MKLLRKNTILTVTILIDESIKMEVKEKLIKFFKDNFMVELNGHFSDDESFLENGIIHSTGVLELIMFLEETYNIKVDEEEIVPENLDSINNIKNYLSTKI